jgi:hypothetical protein
MQVNLRESVLRFAVDMEEKLLANDHKGGLDRMSMAVLFDLMVQEELELMAAIEGGFAPNIIGECVDVANFAMMIAEKAREICDASQVPPG